MRPIFNALLLTGLLLSGCSRAKPQDIPPHFEGNVVIDAYYADSLIVDWTQTGAHLEGTYQYRPSSRTAKPFSGKITGESAGEMLSVKLEVPPEAQQAMAFPAEFRCDLKVTPRGPTLRQLGGFLDFQSGERKMHRMVALLSSSPTPSPSATP